ncbi:MAG: S26 family signal peptidase, partial [Limisphaerales bacterium]
MPGLLWITLITLSIGAFSNLVLTPINGPVSLLEAVFKTLLIAGLWFRFRLAYLATVASAFFAWPVAFKLSSPYGLLLTTMTLAVVVPLVVSTSWFFPLGMNRTRRRAWLGATGVVSLVLFGVMLAAPLPRALQSSGRESRSGRHNSFINTFPRGEQGSEVSLESLDRHSDRRFLDVDNSRIIEPPREYSSWSRTRREQWLNESGVDLMVLGNDSQPWWLLTPQDNPIQLAAISRETWSRGIEPEPTATTPVQGEALQFLSVNLKLLAYKLKHHRPTHPEHTFLFQTANGRRGMLRISGTIVEDMETLAGVKIEFKALAKGEPILFEPIQFEQARVENFEPAPGTDWFTVLLVSVLVIAIGLYWLLTRSKKVKADVQGTRTPSSKVIQALKSVAIAVAIALVLRTFVVAPFYAVSNAASPEVPKGSWVLVFKMTRSFKPGDVVVFKKGGRDKLGRVWDQFYRADSNEGIVKIEGDHTEILHRDVVGKVIFNTRPSRASAQEPLNVRSDLPGNTMASGLDSGSDRGASPRTDFAAKLPNGSFVELVSIQYGGGSTPRQQPGSTNVIDFWNPDGTEHNDNLGWSFSPSALSPKRIPGLEYRGFVVHWNGPVASNTRLMDWEVDGTPDASGIFNVNPPKGESAENWLGILQGFSSGQKTAKLRFALASGAYLEGPTTKTNFIWSRTDNTPWGSYSIGQIFDHNGNAAVRLTHSLIGCDYRLYTQFDQLPGKPKSFIGGLIWEWKEESRRDERYKRIYGRVVKGGTGSSQKMEVWEFPGVPAKEAMARLPQIYFEVRPVQWVEFENVALTPGEQTRIEILVNDRESSVKDLTVSPDGSAAFTTIQAAIDAAPEHAVIRIGPGRYPEKLVIRKPLTLRGAGWNQTVIGPAEPDRMPSEEELFQVTAR